MCVIYVMNTMRAKNSSQRKCPNAQYFYCPIGIENPNGTRVPKMPPRCIISGFTGKACSIRQKLPSLLLALLLDLQMIQSEHCNFWKQGFFSFLDTFSLLIPISRYYLFVWGMSEWYNRYDVALNEIMWKVVCTQPGELTLSIMIEKWL